MQIKSALPLYVLTADIGGSHITAAICHMQSHSILEESVARIEVDSKSSAINIIADWKAAFKVVLRKNLVGAVSGLSVAMPGPFDYQNGISYITGLDKYESLYGMDIKHHLADSLQIDHHLVHFRNDAESTIAGEVLKGAGKNHRRVVGITLGTGFGSAYSENSVIKDLNLGNDRYQTSIADDYFSTRWFLRRYFDLTGSHLVGGVKELAALATGNSIARSIFQEFADNLSGFLSAPINRYGPEVLVICGNIAKASEFFLPHISKKLNPIPVTLAKLGEMAPLIGAAAIFDHPSKFSSLIHQPIS